MSMWIWLSLGFVIAVLSAGFTLLWWKVGDQWADEEYKRFGHGGGGPQGNGPTVIKDFESETIPSNAVSTQSSSAPSDVS